MRMRKRPPDFMLFITVLMLLSIGVIMVFSASEYSALVREYYNHDPFYFLKRQLMWASIGLTAMFFVMNFDYWKLKRYIKFIVGGAFILLVLVLIPGIGVDSHGAQRWIGLGPLTFQPSELVKMCLIVFTAYGLAGKGHRIQSFTRGILPYLLVMVCASGLILIQPDLGTAATLAGTIMVMFFAAGAKISNMVGLAGAGLLAVGVAIAAAPYRMERFLAFLDPWKDPQGDGFHIIQSFLALGSGGFFGTGLGQGRHSKLLYVPEQHTDFIFSAIGEELGFLGGCLVIFLFALFVWRGLKIAITSPDPFACLTAVGLTTGIALQAIINIGVVTGSLPVTGITLPFISFGGTSLIFTLIGVGIILNISKYTTTK
ncbi:stage V sporulation protein E [Desulfolucanica intricata]|uniref:stage V sporulation protein E n=1 Tax=Desulfolucanica intricata TaxID=1285191 RepID=UPI000836122A|nr:stage V sporulation protein E [Desulfolucanica intricata]